MVHNGKLSVTLDMRKHQGYICFYLKLKHECKKKIGITLVNVNILNE